MIELANTSGLGLVAMELIVIFALLLILMGMLLMGLYTFIILWKGMSIYRAF